MTVTLQEKRNRHPLAATMQMYELTLHIQWVPNVGRMFSQRQIWMGTTNRRCSQVVEAMAIHLLSLTESIRDQHTQTQMEKAWTNRRKALIKSPRLSSLHCGYMASWALVIRLQPSSEPSVSFPQDTTTACWTLRSSFDLVAFCR